MPTHGSTEGKSEQHQGGLNHLHYEEPVRRNSVLDGRFSGDSRRRIKALRIPPPTSLAIWLDQKREIKSTTRWTKRLKHLHHHRLQMSELHLGGLSLPGILLHYLQAMQESDVSGQKDSVRIVLIPVIAIVPYQPHASLFE